MGGDQHRGAQPVQLGEKADQARPDLGVHIAGWFVGHQQVGPGDHGARDGDALLLAARKRVGRRVHPVAKPDPGEKLLHILGILTLFPARQLERHGHIVEGREMVEQAEILEHHPDPPPDGGEIGAPGGRQIAAEKGNQAPGGGLGQKDQLEQRCLARTG